MPEEGQRAVTILIADDNDENRLVLKDMLLSLGFGIIEAMNGQDALDKARVYHPDLIFMDLMMPEMDGFEAARQIRQIPALKDVIVIAISANVFEQTRKKSATAGCHDFIAKPLSKQILLEKLQTHLQLEWIYEEHDSQIPGNVHLVDEEAERCLEGDAHRAIIPPPMKELSLLNDMALIGDIIGIREYIETLERDHPQFSPFVVRIRTLAKELKLLEIQDFLKQYSER